MASSSAPETFAQLALTRGLTDQERTPRLEHIRGQLFSQSRSIRDPDFLSIHTSDLGILFDAYDREFFDGLLHAALAGTPLHFHLSRRLTTSAGTTKLTRYPTGEVDYEIAIGARMLFDGFQPGDRPINACGLPCATRLDALQRVFEHELVHLTEYLCWRDSKCSAARFQGIAGRLFGHQTHTHSLITRRERAAEQGIRRNTRVTFIFQGMPLIGRVQRVTRRATVLVEDPAGRLYSNGLRYRTYYVPLSGLTVL